MNFWPILKNVSFAVNNLVHFAKNKFQLLKFIHPKLIIRKGEAYQWAACDVNVTPSNDILFGSLVMIHQVKTVVARADHWRRIYLTQMSENAEVFSSTR